MMGALLSTLALSLWFIAVVLILRTRRLASGVLAAALFGIGCILLIGALTWASTGSAVPR